MSKKSKTAKDKTAKPASKKAAARGAARSNARNDHPSRSETMLDLLRRKGGATIAELTQATGWQPHSVRGFLAGKVKKGLGLELEITKREDGQRAYQLAS